MLGACALDEKVEYVTIELGRNAEAFRFPFPSIRCYPIVLKLLVVEGRHSSGRFIDEVVYRISVL